jgi:phosphate-selective porin OprO/OprP
MPRVNRGAPASTSTARCALWLGVLAALGPASGFADTLTLTSGETLIGKVVSEEEGALVFESAALGKLRVARDRIQRIVLEDKSSGIAAPPAAVPEQPATGEPAATQSAQDAAAAAPASSREDLLRMYWDEGLRFQITQAITVPVPFSNEERKLGEVVKMSGRLGLKVSLDAAVFDATGGQQEVDGDAEIRTFRLYSNGELDLFGRTQYAVQFGSVRGNFYLHEAYLRWGEVKYLGNVTFGYLSVPQTLDNVASFGSLMFMEAPSPSLAFAPGNRMGLAFDRTYLDERATLAFGIFSVGADPGVNFGDASQSLLRPTLRVTALPVLDESKPDSARLLHVGLSASYILTNHEVQYRSRPESSLAPFLVDTGPIDSNVASVIGVEALYMDGPFLLQAETTGAFVQGVSERYQFFGTYVSAGWMLTGEQRIYRKDSASLGGVRPQRDFSWSTPTAGAWELGLRLSHLDLDSHEVHGGRMTIASTGLNWYWNRYLRWQFDYAYARVNEGPSPGNLHLLQMRLQMQY